MSDLIKMTPKTMTVIFVADFSVIPGTAKDINKPTIHPHQNPLFVPSVKRSLAVKKTWKATQLHIQERSFGSVQSVLVVSPTSEAFRDT